MPVMGPERWLSGRGIGGDTEQLGIRGEFVVVALDL
jgi:hypothetical protein